MITITIDKQYKLPENWDEVTLSKAQEIFNVPLPKSLKQYYEDKLLEKPTEKTTYKDLVKTFPTYYGEILKVLGIPENVVKKIRWQDRSSFYNAYLSEFVLGLHFMPKYQVRNLEFIDYGEKLYFPRSKDVLGSVIPFAYTTAVEFAEMADLQIYSQEIAEGRYTVAANITSIMCRPKGEEYDEDTSLERAEKLKDMKMSDVWEVFFCLIELLNTQTELDHLYLRETLISRLKLPLKQRALIAGRTQLSKWGNLRKGLKMSKK